MEENQEKNIQEEPVQEPEVKKEEQDNTDNLSEKEENTDTKKKGFFSKKKDKEKPAKGELTSFQAAMTSVSAIVGSGNIAGSYLLRTYGRRVALPIHA